MKKKLPPLNAVVAFEAAARNKSFKKAGEELCVTSSAISHQVRALEDWLGLKLFERSTRAVELTDFGIRYSLELGALLGRLEKISHTEPGQRKNNKVITIQTTDSFASRWLLPRLPEFESLHPDITIKIVTYDFRDGLRSSEADVGILFLSADQSGAEAGNNHFRLLFPEEIFPVCSPEIVRDWKSIRVGDLSNFTLIHDDNVGVSWQDWITSANKGCSGTATVQTTDSTHYNHAHLALTAAELGNGFTLASNVLSGDALKKGRLVAPFKEKIVTGGGYYLAQSEKARARSECRAFGEWIGSLSC